MVSNFPLLYLQRYFANTRVANCYQTPKSVSITCGYFLLLLLLDHSNTHYCGSYYFIVHSSTIIVIWRVVGGQRVHLLTKVLRNPVNTFFPYFTYMVQGTGSLYQCILTTLIVILIGVVIYTSLASFTLWRILGMIVDVPLTLSIRTWFINPKAASWDEIIT
jgi:hypothetical protein